MKPKSIYLQFIFLAALCVTSSIFVVDLNERPAFDHVLDVEDTGLVLSAADVTFGSENLPRSLQSLKSPFNGFHKGLCFYFVEKVESISTKVSFRYLSNLELYQGREEYLFLDLRKLLI